MLTFDDSIFEDRRSPTIDTSKFGITSLTARQERKFDCENLKYEVWFQKKLPLENSTVLYLYWKYVRVHGVKITGNNWKSYSDYVRFSIFSRDSSRALHTAHTTVDNSSNWIYYDTSETSSSRIESDRKSVGIASGVVYHLERNLKCRSRNAHTIYCPTVGTTPHHNAKLRAKLFSWDFKTGQCTKQARILLHYFLLSYQPWITALGILTIQIKYSISLKKNS